MALRLHELHPTLVHYPLVLFPAAILADLLGRVTGSRALARAGATLMPLAAASAVATGTAGLIAQEAVKPQGKAHDLLVTHRNMNLGLIAASLVMALVRSRSNKPSAAYLLAGLAGMAGMSYTAYLGGKMVYEHGLGVRPAGGLDEAASPEIRRDTLQETLRVSREHAAQGVRHVAEHLRQGELAPALRGGTRSA